MRFDWKAAGWFLLTFTLFTLAGYFVAHLPWPWGFVLFGGAMSAVAGFTSGFRGRA